MKQLLILFMTLIFMGCVRYSDESHTHKMNTVIQQNYNSEFMDALISSILEQDFYLLEKHISDTVGVHCESTDKSIWVSSGELLNFLDVLFDNMPLYSYEIDILTGNGPTIYKLTCLVIVPNDDGSPKLGLALFAFAENNGKIDVVLIP